MGTHVHNSFYDEDEEMFDEPRVVIAENEEHDVVAFEFVPPTEPKAAERRIETMTAEQEITAFKIRVQKPGNTRVSTIEFHAAGWSEAVDYGRSIGRLLSVALASEK